MATNVKGGSRPPTLNRQAFVAIGLSGLVAMIIGCGGSGGTSSGNPGGGTAPTGVAAVRTSSLASVQSLNAGIAFPFAAVQDSAPSGSVIKALAFLKSPGTRGSGPTYNSALNLYASAPAASGGTQTISYYTDAAGTQPAGSMTLQVPGGSFNFSSYPATVSVNVNVTAGNMPCKGSASIVYQDSAGKNEIKGSINLTKNSEQLTVDLNLSDSGDVTGTMQVVESNTTLSVTNVSGPFSGTQSCNFTMSPQGYSGTGTIDLDTASLSLHFTNPANASCTTDSTGNLSIQYPDGSQETITNPLTALLSGTVGTSGSTSSAGGTGSTAGGTGSTSTSGSTGTTTTTTGNAMFEAPVLTKWALQGNQGYTLGGSDKLGEVVGSDQIKYEPVFAASVTSAVQYLDASGLTGAANAINSNRAIVGSVFGQVSEPAYWSSPTAKVMILQFPSNLYSVTASGINDSGAIVGSGVNGGTTVGLYWSNLAASPVTFSIPIETSGPSIDNSGRIFVASEFGVGYMLNGYTATAVPLAPLNPNNGNTAMVYGNPGFSLAGVVGASAVNAYTGTATMWTSPTSPQVLPIPAGFTFSGANAINNAGEATGWFNTGLGGSFHLALWEPGKTAIDLNSLFTGGVTPTQGLAMLNDGSLIASGRTATTVGNYFLKRKQ